MSQYELYTEAGPSSQITLSQAGIPPPSSAYSIGIIDEPLTPDHSISQQPIYSRPESSILQTEPNLIPPNLRRIGPKHQKFWVLWTTMNKTDFIERWRHTAGAHPHPPLHKVNFEARYTAAAWEHFNQVAHFQTGKPMALCRRCGKALSHPSSTLNGSKSLSAHLSSRACVVASKRLQHNRIYSNRSNLRYYKRPILHSIDLILISISHLVYSYAYPKGL